MSEKKSQGMWKNRIKDLHNFLVSNKIFRIVLVSVTGLFISYQFIKRIDHTFIFDFIPEIFFGILGLWVFVWAFFRDKKAFSKSRNSFDFLSTFVGGILLTGLLTTLYILNQRDNSPSKLFCVTKIIDFNGVSIDFREDGTYLLQNGTVYGGDDYRGDYTREGSIITLDKSDIGDIIKSNRLMVVEETKDSQFSPKEVYQIDSTGQIIDGAEDFIVRVKK